MCVVSAGAVIYSAVKARSDEPAKLPLTGVLGAFVFAAQMVNFTIPGTGSSGHIGGGMLLAAILGGPSAMLAISAVLIIQALFFADGGILALGCNIFNMGVIPCLIVYPLLFKPLIKKLTAPRLAAASLICCILTLQLGAFAVVLETTLSGITSLPFGTFSALMLPIHLAIGAIEGVLTAAVLCFVLRARPELLNNQPLPSLKKTALIFAGCALAVGAGLALLASSNPDGLEWSILHTAGSVAEGADGALSYDSTPASIAGGVLVFILAAAAAFIIKKRIKKQ